MPPCATASAGRGVCADEIVGRRDPQRVPHLVVARVRFAVTQVVGDRSGEQVAALGYQPDLRPQPFDVRSRTSTPSTKTAPAVTSYNRQINATSVDFPEPVLPMIAVLVPGRAVSEISCSTARSAPGYWNDALSSRTTPR